MNWEDIFHPFSEADFQQHAIALFYYQYEHNEVYRLYCNLLKVHPTMVTTTTQIPFLPISFFKTHEIKTGAFEPEIEFRSSGTTGNENSRHLIKDTKLYERAFLSSFEHVYGNPSQYCFLALLHNYLEQKHASLVYMMNKLISISKYEESGFYLYNFDELYTKIVTLMQKNAKTILFGVSFALLDFVEFFNCKVRKVAGQARNDPQSTQLMVFETGGMKGRRPEMVKEELHYILCNAFGVSTIHSEYGMCELMSQAYSSGENHFTAPPWMKLLLRDEKNPFFCSETLTSGAINIIDFANVHSCAFIATDDLGKRDKNGKVELLGRLDAAQIRGCNLMYL
jgi:phenylacetate-coenzyme A ligase PaaK-like adenylate-forming protein